MSIFKKITLAGIVAVVCMAGLSLSKVNADIIGTYPSGSYNGYTFYANVYTGDYNRFIGIYNKIPDTVTMDIPFTTAINAYIFFKDKNPLNYKGATKGITKYIANNIKAGDDLGTDLNAQMIKLVNFPTDKAETKKVVAALPVGVDKSQVMTVGNSTKNDIISFVSKVLDDFGTNLGLTQEESDIIITAVYVGEIKFKITQFDFVPGSSNKITLSIQKTPTTLDPAEFSKLLGAKKSVIDYLVNLFTKESPYIDGTVARNIQVLTPASIIKISGSGFTDINNTVKLTTAPSSESNDQKASLLATPHSFTGYVYSFFSNVWSFFVNIIPFTHGQITNTYIIGNLASDDSVGTSITFSIPTNVANGVYSISVASDNTNWLSTGFKATITNGTATVSGSAGINNGVYSDGATIPATATYKCPTNSSSVHYMITSTNTCILIPQSGNGMTTVIVSGSSGSVPAGYTTIPATLTYTCPLVPSTITGYYSLVSVSTCVFHASAAGTVTTTGTTAGTTGATSGIATSTSTVITDGPVATSTNTAISTTTAVTPPVVVTPPAQISVAATVKYTCPSTATLSGMSCITYDTVGIAAIAKYVTGSFISSAPAHYVYSCSSGYILRGQRCYSNSAITTSATPVYSCASGYALNSTTKMCVK